MKSDSKESRGSVLQFRPRQRPAARDAVRVFPSPNGLVHLVGVSAAGNWVAELRIRAELFDERTIEYVEGLVAAHERGGNPTRA